MGENGNHIDKEDALHDVIAKLCAIGDFMQHIGNESYTMYKQTPEGLCLIMSECIRALKTIGGLNEQTTKN